MIDIYSSSSNLGDNLGLSCLALAAGGMGHARVHMYDDKGCRAVAPVFEGVCEVVHDNGSPTTHAPRSTDPEHIQLPLSQRHLLAYGLRAVSAIPEMKLRPEEIEKARQFLVQFGGNPLCILKCSPQVTDVRTPPIELMRKIVAANKDTTFLNFGLSKSHPKHNFANVIVDDERVKTFLDLPIREQAAIYHVVGRYIGPDTGDYHMMLAVGGTCDVLVPVDSPAYSYRRFHYNADCWQGKPVRVRYFNWTLPIESPFITGLRRG